jgi:hypothetical protein
MGSYRLYIYIYYLIKYCRAGGYPSDQNSKNRYPSVIRIFKISVSVRIYASGRADGRADRPDWVPRFFAHPDVGNFSTNFQKIKALKNLK